VISVRKLQVIQITYIHVFKWFYSSMKI
jgi:hypothetical protein